MAIRQRTYTSDDLWELSHNQDDKRYELIEGILYDMTPAGGKHGGIALRIGSYILVHVTNHNLGLTTAAETGYSLTADGQNVLAPDVGFVSRGRLDELPDGYIPLAPDLAVEVVSPNDRAQYIHEKVKKFLEAGTQEVWVVYPNPENVVIHTHSTATTLAKTDTIDGGTLLPGFSLAVANIFL